MLADQGDGLGPPIDLSALDPPESCHTDPARLYDPLLCERAYWRQPEGALQRCEHAFGGVGGQEPTCLLSTELVFCSPPPPPLATPAGFCAQLERMTDLRSLSPPQTCHSDATRAQQPEKCAEAYVTQGNGLLQRCKHVGGGPAAAATCVMSRFMTRCGLPPTPDDLSPPPGPTPLSIPPPSTPSQQPQALPPMSEAAIAIVIVAGLLSFVVCLCLAEICFLSTLRRQRVSPQPWLTAGVVRRRGRKGRRRTGLATPRTREVERGGYDMTPVLAGGGGYALERQVEMMQGGAYDGTPPRPAQDPWYHSPARCQSPGEPARSNEYIERLGRAASARQTPPRGAASSASGGSGSGSVVGTAPKDIEMHIERLERATADIRARRTAHSNISDSDPSRTGTPTNSGAGNKQRDTFQTLQLSHSKTTEVHMHRTAYVLIIVNQRSQSSPLPCTVGSWCSPSRRRSLGLRRLVVLSEYSI